MRLMLLLLSAIVSCNGCMMPDPIRVMSFNIRYGTANDHGNRWELRRDLVFQTIRADDPDLIGLQEVLGFQAKELRAELPDYGYVGVGRDDGRSRGEAVPVMYRRETFDLADYGFIWLGEDQARPGIKAWDAACPRVLTWVRLRFKRSPLNDVYVVNTHFDHVGRQARLESARIVRRLTDTLGGRPVIVLGDFNCPPGSAPYETLTEDRGNLAELSDAYALLARAENDQNPLESAESKQDPARGAQNEQATFHSFVGLRRGKRIDWILFNRRFNVLEAAIDRRNFDGRYPSDHFPVTATLRLKPATDTGAM